MRVVGVVMGVVESDLRSHPAVGEAEELSPFGDFQLILPDGPSHPPAQAWDERVQEIVRGLAAPLLSPAFHSWKTEKHRCLYFF